VLSSAQSSAIVVISDDEEELEAEEVEVKFGRLPEKVRSFDTSVLFFSSYNLTVFAMQGHKFCAANEVVCPVCQEDYEVCVSVSLCMRVCVRVSSPALGGHLGRNV
jgi:hypothetical protein